MCWGEDKKKKRQNRRRRSAEVDRAVKSLSRVGDGDISRIASLRPPMDGGLRTAARLTFDHCQSKKVQLLDS